MATKYSLTVKNDSKNYGSICVFQTMPDQPDNMLSLAWFSKPAHPDTAVEFDWMTQYNFVWSDQGELKPGITFKASQVLDADPSDVSKNSIALVKEFDAYHFQETDKTTKEGNLGIYTNQTVPHGDSSVGIGMSGNVAFAAAAAPNNNHTFTPDPEYWVTFGTYEAGEVIDKNSISNLDKIKFEPNEFHKKITFDGNTWNV